MSVENLIVSDEFIEIYRNFNITNQHEKMRKLSQRDLYLLLILCLDKHSDEDVVVVENFRIFENDCMDIFNIQDDGEVEDEDLKYLIDRTGNKYIDTDIIIDVNGNKLPNPYTLAEARDIKIKLLQN